MASHLTVCHRPLAGFEEVVRFEVVDHYEEGRYKLLFAVPMVCRVGQILFKCEASFSLAPESGPRNSNHACADDADSLNCPDQGTITGNEFANKLIDLVIRGWTKIFKCLFTYMFVK
jgi:hypothetical protein